MDDMISLTVSIVRKYIVVNWRGVDYGIFVLEIPVLDNMWYDIYC